MELSRPCVVVLALLACLPEAARGEEGIPPMPGPGEWTQDYADLLTAEDAREIDEIQVRAGHHGVALIVVTIDRMDRYLATGGIEEFAREWFDAWEIGSSEQNTGILVLVSRQDRKARIELGADWGRGWDGYCQRVMDNTMVPAFKRGDYSGGIRAGVADLEVMAGRGPHGSPPDPGFLDRLQQIELVRMIRAYQPIPPGISLLLVGLGVVLVVASFIFTDQRKPLLIAGIGFIVLGICVWIIVALAAAHAKGSGTSSGGFGGGGFSGGGGASGSW